MPRLLRNLKIKEVSSVTRGAGEGVRIMLRKALGETAIDKAFAALGDATIQKDGSVDFDGAYAAIEATEQLQGVMNEIDEAAMALRRSFCSIMDDPDLADKQGAFAASFDQFKEHLAGLAPDGMEKAVVAAAASRLKASNGEIDMTPEQINAAIKKAVDEQMAPLKKADEEKATQIAKLETELAVAKLSADHKAAMDGMSDDEKAKWLKMSADERDAKLKTKKDAADLNKGVDQTPVVKALEQQLSELRKSNEHLARDNAARIEADEIRKAEDECEALGLSRAHGAVMRKAFAGDPTAIKEHKRQVESLARLAKEGAAFSTFAANGGGDLSPDSPIAKVNKRVEEMQAAARADNKTISRDQAIAKLATTDAKLFREYRAAVNKNPAAAATAH
jgi:hypothetical protein